jgi:4a-hydroxytetrahydrobiopterin dehydratase
MVKGSARVLTDEEIAARLAAGLPHWSVADGHLCRRYRTAGWRATLMVANAIGHLAEAAWHHPDLVLSYARVEVRLTTHDAGGITEKDFALAARIEDVVGWRPGEEDGPLDGIPADDPRHAYIKYDVKDGG